MRRPSAVPCTWAGLICLIAASVGADPAGALVVISICNEAGNFAHCPLGPMASRPDGALEYVPRAAAEDQFTQEGLLTSGWISVPSASSILLSALGSSEIRSIVVPTSVPTLLPAIGQVTAEADGTLLGTFQPGASIDFDALLGSRARSVRLTSSQTDPDFTHVPWLVRMRGFEPTMDPLSRQPAHLLVQVPEPSAGALLAVGLALVAAVRRARN